MATWVRGNAQELGRKNNFQCNTEDTEAGDRGSILGVCAALTSAAAFDILYTLFNICMLFFSSFAAKADDADGSEIAVPPPRGGHWPGPDRMLGQRQGGEDRMLGL